MKILVVEPSADTAEQLAGAVRRQGYTVQTAQRGHEAMTMYPGADLVLLNLDLPDVDGLEVCRSMRSAAATPVICLSDRDSTLDRVLALKVGADDCVVRACGEREIIARIEAVMRRTVGRWPMARVISLRALRIDGRSREVRLRGELVEVTSKEFELLYTLASQPEAVVSRKELMARIWDDNWGHASRTIDTHVSSLRAKLGSPGWILTVRGVGYRMGYGFAD
ncbi:MAG: DNA-binding response regulator [Catenulispora sp. 13_1_20CM_3_70_7]|jgi:DNA-binding response OmpR family regulator|nr:MAG: DNA-binding response regulator [Catenulispora sp. 13_1_20CM_3_70_7]